MKVLCIDDNPKGIPEANWLVKEGEIYDVVDEFEHSPYGRYYELQIQKDVGYMVEIFIPLSDIDETEFVRETKKELV